jgi:Cu-Zn family superoxide dismutase
MKAAIVLALGALVATTGAALAQSGEMRVTMNKISTSGVGEAIGTITIAETAQGLTFRPELAGLPAGERGFHVHERPDCGAAPNPQGQVAAGFAAGGHYDPDRTSKHMGPQAEGGHKGDLPALVVGTDGRATQPVTASRLKLADVTGRALMIHAGGDNYSDQPEPLGGGGGRVACGVIR